MLSYFLPLSGFILKHEDAQDFFFLLHCCSSRSRARQVWNLLWKNQTWQWSNCKLSSKCSKVKRPNETHSQLHSLEACRCSTEEKRRPMHLARWWKWSVQLGRGPNACGPSSFKLLLLIGGLLAVTCATVSISHTVIAKLWAYKSMTLSFQESEKLQ